MNMKRASFLAGAVFSALALSATNGGVAEAASYGHAWNDSPSVNMCLAAAAGGTRVIQWTCGSGAEQNWVLYGLGNNIYSIQNEETGECIQSSGVKGSQIYTGACNGPTDVTSNMKWRWVSTDSDGYRELQSTTDYYCLSISGGSLSSGADAIEWNCQGTPDQYWDFTAVAGY